MINNCDKGRPSKTVRRVAYRRAAQAWTAGKPHTAWEILASFGLADDWPEFRREALRRARQTFRVRMAGAR